MNLFILLNKSQRSKRNLLVSTSVLVTGWVVACGKLGGKAQPEGASSTDAGAQGVLVQQSTLWQSGKPLVVCWSSSHSSQAEFRKDVENHVITNFANTQRLRIQKGWKNCDSLNGQFDIGVVVYDDPAFQSLLKSNKSLAAKMSFGDRPGNPRVRDWGKFLRGDAHGIVLNTSGLGRHSGAVARLNKLTPQGRMNYALSTSLHEFGHAVGLRHEHAHPESECDLFNEDLRRPGLPQDARAVTPYDRNSIMNYCRFATSREEYNPELNSKIFHFSPGDIATINKGY